MLFWKAEEKLWDAYKLEKGELVLELLTLCCWSVDSNVEGVIYSDKDELIWR